MRHTKRIDIEMRYMKFMSAVFQVIANELENERKKIEEVMNARQRDTKRQVLAKWWLGYLESRRQGIYDEIIEVAESIVRTR